MFGGFAGLQVVQEILQDNPGNGRQIQAARLIHRQPVQAGQLSIARVDGMTDLLRSDAEEPGIVAPWPAWRRYGAGKQRKRAELRAKPTVEKAVPARHIQTCAAVLRGWRGNKQSGLLEGLPNRGQRNGARAF